MLLNALFLSGISSQELCSFFSTSPTSNIFWPLFQLSARLGNFPNDLEMDCSSADGHVLSCPIPGHKSWLAEKRGSLFEVEGAFGGHPAAFETAPAARLVSPVPSLAIWFPDLLWDMELFMMLLIENKWLLILPHDEVHIWNVWISFSDHSSAIGYKILQACYKDIKVCDWSLYSRLKL